MQTILFHKLLTDFSVLLESCGATQTPKDLRDLGQLLDDGGATVSTLVKGLEKRVATLRTATESGPVRRFREQLRGLQSFLETANSKASGDLALMADLLQGCGHASIAQLVAEILAAPSVRAPSITTSKRQGAERAPGGAKSVDDLRTAVVEAIVNDLQRTSQDSAAFRLIVDGLKADKRVRKQEMLAIGNQFLGRELTKSASKEKIVEEISKRQSFDARQRARLAS
jgi:hypothetical protein